MIDLESWAYAAEFETTSIFCLLLSKVFADDYQQKPGKF
jgi:hypothetical protein